MLILPDRNIPRTKLLMPVPVSQWRTPSQAQPKDQFCNENRTRFRVRARLNDGHIIWCGWFDDRADFDQFLWSIATGELWHDRYVQRLPTPYWPGLDPLVGYDFATVTFLTSPTGSNQTYSTPADWNNASNSIDCLGAGASGGANFNSSTPRNASGGGGGGWGQYVNLTLTGSITYQLGTGGVAKTPTSGNVLAGAAGGDTWFNGSTYAAASTGGLGGGAGAATSAGSASAASGGSGKGSVTANAGGGSGAATVTGANNGKTGGGGAGGPNAAGVASGTASGGVSASSAGGQGDGSSGGVGGAAGSASPAVAGSNGTEWDASHGSGGGGGAGGGTSNPSGASGGNYGGGGGGCAATVACSSGAGIQGIIVVTYTPTTPFFGGMLTDSARGRQIIIGY